MAQRRTKLPIPESADSEFYNFDRLRRTVLSCDSYCPFPAYNVLNNM